MRFILAILIFSYPLTLFSYTVGGLELYPAMAMIPLGIYEILSRPFYSARLPIPKYVLVLFLWFLMLLVHSLAKPFIAKDILKLAVFLLMYRSLVFSHRSLKIDVEKILDYAVCASVIFGVFQIVAALFGRIDLANLVHSLVPSGEYGAVNERGLGEGGAFRVAGLTPEPSYFAFIVSCYFLLTKKRWVRWFCVVGILISFSLITAYAWTGIFLFWVARSFGFPSFLFYVLGLLVHLSFVASFYRDIPELLFPTFFDRYAALAEFYQTSDWIETLFGSFYVNEFSPVNLIRPYSNIGSVAYLFGLFGFGLYCYFFSLIEKVSVRPYAIAILFLLMFNYYYLTSWPVIAGLFFLAMDNRGVLSEG